MTMYVLIAMKTFMNVRLMTDMTNDEMREFKTLFGKYCRHEMNLGHCTGDTCEWCPIQKAYEEVENFEKIDSQIKVLIYDIEWDTDGEKVKLPKQVEHVFEDYDNINDEDLLDEISDWLSDEYGYCHKGFCVKLVEEDEDDEI